MAVPSTRMPLLMSMSYVIDNGPNDTYFKKYKLRSSINLICRSFRMSRKLVYRFPHNYYNWYSSPVASIGRSGECQQPNLPNLHPPYRNSFLATRFRTRALSASELCFIIIHLFLILLNLYVVPVNIFGDFRVMTDCISVQLNQCVNKDE